MQRKIRLSVCLSDTLRYCVKTRKRRGMRSSPSGSPVSLAFWCQEWLMEDDHVRVNFECKEVDPCENSPTVQISPHNSGTVTDSEESSIKTNRKSTMGFPMSHQPRLCVHLISPKWSSDTKICCFGQKFRPQTTKSLLQSFIV